MQCRSTTEDSRGTGDAAQLTEGFPGTRPLGVDFSPHQSDMAATPITPALEVEAGESQVVILDYLRQLESSD